MDFSAKLDQLQAKTNEAVASARAAAAENRDQLKQRVDKQRTTRSRPCRTPSSKLTRLWIAPRASGRR